MRTSTRALITTALLLFFALPTLTQPRGGRQVRSLGQVTTQGNLIVVNLEENAFGKANLFDLEGRTLRFTREGERYRASSGPLKWDPEFGRAANGRVTLDNIAFPISGQERTSFSIGNGAIFFGDRDVTFDRFATIPQIANRLVSAVPYISVFLKPRMSGQRYVKQLADRVLITWDLTEPHGGIQDMSWAPTVNRFQATLYRDGSVEMSYQKINAEDAVVGLYTATGSTVTSVASDLSTLTAESGSFATVFEDFHYLPPPRATDITCTVLRALGDHYDFLAFYSDFRIDNPEAGTSSTGPLGGGPNGGAVTGIGAQQRNLSGFCTEGRFQWQYIQPVYSGSNQMQERPPAGFTGPTSDPKMPPYNYGISQLAHEMGHRWSAFVSARVNGETIDLGPTHWARGLHAPVPFPYQRKVEASAMGGGVWQDNGDGTFTQFDDDYYVPATGWSYLDLYLMGLMEPAEVPGFYILRNIANAGRDAEGHPIVRASQTKLTVQNVIDAMGPRLPATKDAQKEFNTGFVLLVEHGKKPSPHLVEAAEGIRTQWIEYWDITTGHRSKMTVNPKP